MGLFAERKRRNVFRVAIAYILLGWAVLQGADFPLDLAGAHDEALQVLHRPSAQDVPYFSISLLRVSAITGDFNCQPYVQAFYAEVGLPPLPEPPDCGDL